LHLTENTRYSWFQVPKAELTVKAIRRHLDKVLGSPAFGRNERLSRFLRFAVELHLQGLDHELKESVIGTEIFGRKPNYDPKSDGIVRNEARRLRALLSEYYLGEGQADALVIDLPKGGYVPVIRPGGRRGAGFSLRRPLARVWFGIGLVAVLAAVASWMQFGPHKAPIRIAVLPLVNVSQYPAADYLADGLTGELISNLSIIEGLEVRSQTSSFVFKGKPRNVRVAGRQLQVDFILEGSVQREENRLRILAALIRVRDDLPLWSGRYDREAREVLAIQDEISRGIVNSLRLKLGGGRRRYETSAAAYDFYLRARALEIEQGLRGVNQSVEPFERAITEDPSFAPAYAGLAAAYAFRTSQEVIKYGPPLDRGAEMTKMRVAARKALELDPLLAEACDALGMIHTRDAQWKEAEKSFRRALELEPNRSLTRTDLVLNLLLPLSRTEEAIEQVRAAEKADPLSPRVQNVFAAVLIAAGRFEEAAARCSKLAVQIPFESVCLARALVGQGKVEDAIRILETRSSASESARAALGYAYARAGFREKAEKVAAALPIPIQQALIFAGLGDKDRTFDALDRSIPLGGVRIGRDLAYPEFAFLRGDPRLTTLRKKVGLPE
jgi:serine/threonine-protein kinase